MHTVTKTKSPIKLTGITWGHNRGYAPLTATAQRFEELQPGVRIEWHKRSLQAFADQPINQLAKEYDLLVIDHPWTGFAARTGVILPLDDWLPRSFLQDQEANSVGQSHESYSYNDQQWALAIDAAAPVAAMRADLLEFAGVDTPCTWEDLLYLANQGAVAVPSIPQDTLMNFYMLCSTLGEDPCEQNDFFISEHIGLEALDLLRELSSLLDKRCFDWNPIQIYEAMSSGNDFSYCPFAYGYVNYAQRNYAEHQLKFGDLVELGDHGRCRTTLGGTGLAISANSEHKWVAAEYAEFVASQNSQTGMYVDFGGQPGHRAAWLDDDVNARTNDYFSATLPALDRAFLRPRYFGHMDFQDRAGTPIRDFLMNGGSDTALLSKLNTLYLESRAEQQCQHPLAV